MGRMKCSPELREQILKEVREVGVVSTVARNHGVSAKTVHNWLRTVRSRGSVEQWDELRALKKQLKDLDLENRVLKSLLKKTYPHWESAEKL